MANLDRENGRYYIASGALNKMYTLRHRFNEPIYSRSIYGTTVVGSRVRDWHVAVLSNNADLAIEKAKAICGKELDINFKLGEIKRGEDIDYSIFRFGKYSGREVEEVCDEDPNYCIWVAENYRSVRHSKTIELVKLIMADRIREKKEREEAEKAEKDWADAHRMDAIVSNPEIAAIADRLLTHEDYAFAMAIGKEMKTGLLPKGRGIHLIADCMGKELGRRNSKKYKAEYERVYALLETLSK